ncbi:MAG: hypothetical protein WCK02_01085 [Bacteroidota bacterium]
MKYIIWGLIFLAFSCKPKEQKVTEKTFENGSPKVVSVYNDKDTKKDKLEEISYHSNGKVFTQGKFKNQQKDGLWTSFYPNGIKWSETLFKEGLSEGKTTTWYDNGKLRYEGVYAKGKPSGIWKYWDLNGKLVFEKDYAKK